MAKLNIPLLDLSAQYREIAAEIQQRFAAVLDSQRFILGPEVEEAENRIADYCGARFAIGVASGTDALVLALKALGVGPGHEVITPAFTFYATASSVVHVGARPVLVDIEPETCLIRPEAIAAAVTERTRAIIPVHLFGQCADMDRVLKLAAGRGLLVIEDACQAIGAHENGRRAGSWGHAAALSFYPSKNLGAFGDGGMVLTSREDVAEVIRRLRVHGASHAYHHELIGYNSRLDTLQAAVLLAKLPHLDRWAEARTRHAALYDQRFQGSAIRPLARRPGCGHVYNNYVVRVPRRDELMAHLQARGIGCAVYYPVPLHRMPCFAPCLDRIPELPAAEAAARECLALPVYPEMTEAMVEEVAAAALGFYG